MTIANIISNINAYMTTFVRLLGNDLLGKGVTHGLPTESTFLGGMEDPDTFTFGISGHGKNRRLTPLTLFQKSELRKKFKRALLQTMEEANIIMAVHVEKFVEDSINFKEIFEALDYGQCALQICKVDVDLSEPYFIGFAFTRKGESSPPSMDPADCAKWLASSEQVKLTRAA